MTQPTLQVKIGFRTGGGGAIVMTDVTTYVQNVNISRGRSRQLQQFNSGAATLSLWNKTRNFDPLNTASPFWNTFSNITGITPRLPITISANGTLIYTGLVTDWNIDYDLGNNDIAIVNCSDNFTVLANNTLGQHDTVEQSSSARVSTVLAYSEVAYTGATSITTGSSVLGGTPAAAGFSIDAGENLLNYLQTVTTSEQGFLYMSADGTLTFKGRTSVLNKPSGATFNGDGTGIQYSTLNNQYGDELLYNWIRTQSPAGAEQVVSDATSIALYQTQTYSETGLLNSTITAVKSLGQYLLGKYKNPVLRLTGLSTQLSALSLAKQNIALSLDLTSLCTVVKNFAAGTPTSTTQQLIVSGINHSITPGSHIISFTFESTDSSQYFTLNDTVFGTLSTTNLLAF